MMTCATIPTYKYKGVKCVAMLYNTTLSNCHVHVFYYFPLFEL